MNDKKYGPLLFKAKSSEAAFTKLYEYFYPKIVVHIALKYGNKELAEEVAQDFFIKMLKKGPEEEIEFPTAWVFTVCENIAKNYFAKYSVEFATDYDLNILKERRKQLDIELFGDYAEKLNRLDPDTKQIIVMNVFEGYDLKEIAERLDINYGAVRQRFCRAIAKLRKM